MIYAIDFDSRQVESKSEDRELLDQYVADNDLSLAVALIDSIDELCLQFTIGEMKDVYGYLNGNPPDFKSEEEAADAVWDTLEDHQDQFPNFTKALGKKLVKKTVSGSVQTVKPSTKAKVPAKQKPSTQSLKVKAKDLMGMNFCKGPKTPRNGTSFCIFTEFLDENFDEATFDELVQTFIDNYKPKNPNKPVDEALGRAYVRDAFNGGYIEEGL